VQPPGDASVTAAFEDRRGDGLAKFFWQVDSWPPLPIRRTVSWQGHTRRLAAAAGIPGSNDLQAVDGEGDAIELDLDRSERNDLPFRHGLNVEHRDGDERGFARGVRHPSCSLPPCSPIAGLEAGGDPYNSRGRVVVWGFHPDRSAVAQSVVKTQAFLAQAETTVFGRRVLGGG
jgi:hypothetical protein